MSKKLAGSFVALITPFNKDGSVDFAAFRTLLKFHEEHGTSAVLIMGSTGETSMLSPDEKKKIIVETAKMKTPGMPIFFGCTGNNTEATIANVRFAKTSRTLAAACETPGLTTAERIEALYVAALSRKPTPKELARLVPHVSDAAQDRRPERLGDVFWLLLNSAEFRLNH